MRASALEWLPEVLDDIRSWANLDHAWTQRYIVQTHCRVLCTAVTGRVVSKPEALRWAYEHLDPAWRPLLTQVSEDRLTPWRPVDPPRPGSMERAFELATYVVGEASARRSRPAPG